MCVRHNAILEQVVRPLWNRMTAVLQMSGRLCILSSTNKYPPVERATTDLKYVFSFHEDHKKDDL